MTLHPVVLLIILIANFADIHMNLTDKCSSGSIVTMKIQLLPQELY